MLKNNHAEQRNKLVPKENNVQGQDSWQGENGLPPPSLFYVVYWQSKLRRPVKRVNFLSQDKVDSAGRAKVTTRTYPGPLTLFRLGEGGGAFDATLDLNPLLLTNDCVYSVPTSWIFLKFTWEQFGVVRFW